MEFALVMMVTVKLSGTAVAGMTDARKPDADLRAGATSESAKEAAVDDLRWKRNVQMVNRQLAVGKAS